MIPDHSIPLDEILRLVSLDISQYGEPTITPEERDRILAPLKDGDYERIYGETRKH